MEPYIYILAQNNERYRFVCEFIFSQVLSIPYQLISSPAECIREIPIIAHGHSNIANSLQIPDCGLMNKTEFEPIDPNPIGEGFSLKLFVDHKQDLDFDLFAMTFFLLSRYEEYGQPNTDIHQRYCPENSCLFSAKIPYIAPILDYRILEFGQLLKEKWGVQPSTKSLQFQLTVDIDIAWKYKAKGWYRTLGSILLDSANLRFKSLSGRISVLLGIKYDPFETYQVFVELSQKYQIPLHFFWLLARNRNKYDRNACRTSPKLKKLIASIAQTASNGIHYSYSAFEDPEILKDEIGFLQNIILVSSGRAHFLRFKFPETPLNLIQHGITDDFSLGYASIPGFRAGTTHPFPFFNLVTNSITKLMLHSTAFMDGTVVDYLKLSPAKAEELFESLIQSSIHCGGEFIFLFHNETLSHEKRWEKWSPLFIRLIEKTSKIKAID